MNKLVMGAVSAALATLMAPSLRATQSTRPTTMTTVVLTLTADTPGPDRFEDLKTAIESQRPASERLDRSVSPSALRGPAIARLRDERFREHRTRVAAELRALGAELVYELRGHNALIARVPTRLLARIGAVPGVAEVQEDVFSEALLGTTIPAMLVSDFWQSGYAGTRARVAVVDSGLHLANSAFVARAAAVHSRVFHGSARYQANYLDSPTDPDDFGGHGTSVAGIVFSQGTQDYPDRKGVSPAIDRLYNLKAAYATATGSIGALQSDTMAAIDSALFDAAPPDIINYSYGAISLVDDDGFARFFDGVVDTYGKTIAVAAGNDGSFPYALRNPGIAYNVITVGNVDTAGTADRADDVISPTSSAGPTADGRKKPDISSPGTNIATTSFQGGWTVARGTSFAAPTIAGAAALLFDAGVTDPRSIKAVMLNAADDRGEPGWDTRYGWGYYNGARTFAWRQHCSTVRINSPGTAGQVRFFGRSTPEPTKATVVWNRAVTYSGGSAPSTGSLDNIDLYAYSEASNSLRDSSVSTKDNVEQVASGVAEPAVLVVTAASPFPLPDENVALAHSGGFVERVGPQVSIVLSAPTPVALGAAFEVTAFVRNGGDLTGHAYQATLSLPAGFTLISGAISQSVGALAPGVAGSVRWTLRAPSAAQAGASLQVDASTSSYGWTWAARATSAVTVRSGMAASPSSLRFAATKAGADGAMMSVTGPQAVSVSFVGGSPSWTATTSQPWLEIVNGAGTGAGQFTVAIVNPRNVIGSNSTLVGSIAISAGGDYLPVSVALTVDQTGGEGTGGPFGQVDTPVQNAAGVVGTIGLTGWALDDVAVSSVQIYRNCLPFEEESSLTPCQTLNGFRLVYLGQASFLPSARPDVDAAFPTHPQSYRAGWGFLILTNVLPHVPKALSYGGQGTLSFYAFATDAEGRRTLLGRSRGDHTPTTITMDNDAITVPFGAIDTPEQGQTVSGTLVNFGWALTPDADTRASTSGISIPIDGSTMNVFVDGVPVGRVNYNHCRGSASVGSPGIHPAMYCDDDVSNVFGQPTPQAGGTIRLANPTPFRNLDAGRAAIGFFELDTTSLSNGLHTIEWGVIDSAGRPAGIGSRFFNVANPGAVPSVDRAAPPGAAAAERADARSLETQAASSAEVLGRTGIDPRAAFQPLLAGEDGVRRVQIPELGRLELQVGPVETAYLVVNGALRDLPVGSRLNAGTGEFSWAAGPGFVGTYRLAFVRENTRTLVEVTVGRSRRTTQGESEIRMSLDLPRDGETVGADLVVSGWVLDPQADIGNGVDAVHVWARRRDIMAGQPVFLGAAALREHRPDVGRAFGAQFDTAGYRLTTTVLPAGRYEVTAYAWNRRTRRWEDARSVSILVR